MIVLVLALQFCLLKVLYCAMSWDSASPIYQILYDYDNVISSEEAHELYNTQPNENYSYDILRYQNFEHLCLVPRLNSTAIENERRANEPILNETEFNKLKREENNLVSDTLRSITDDYASKNICISQRAQYWTYEFCFNGEFIQFHSDVGETSKAPCYKLGQVANDKARGNVYEISSNDLVDNDGGAYVSQLIGDGSICDITGKPRSTFVQYKCGKGLTAPVISSVSELKTCQYRVIIMVPELCEMELFQTKPKLSYDLSCRLIESDSTPVGKSIDKINLVNYNLNPLGYNIFIADPKGDGKVSSLITNKLDISDKEILRHSIINAFTQGVIDLRFKLPGNVLMTMMKNPGLAASFASRKFKTNFLTDDEFIYVAKLYDFTGKFIDNVEIHLDIFKQSSVTFGLELIGDDKSALENEWYGTHAENLKTVMGNFIMVNGVMCSESENESETNEEEAT